MRDFSSAGWWQVLSGSTSTQYLGKFYRDAERSGDVPTPGWKERVMVVCHLYIIFPLWRSFWELFIFLLQGYDSWIDTDEAGILIGVRWELRGPTVPILQEEVYLGFCSSEGGPWSTTWNGSPRAQSPPGGPSFGFSTPTCTKRLVGMMAGLSWANVSNRGQVCTAHPNTRLPSFIGGT